MTRIFGSIPGYPEGSLFESRIGLSRAGVHRPTQAGISGSAKEGADSIVLSGGYEDDCDLGNVIIYTGHGGRDPDTGQQVRDQMLIGGNLALAYSCMQGLPVRVIRGSNHNSPDSPPFGYRYDGIYRVESYWRDIGQSNFTIWRFRLVKLIEENLLLNHFQEMPEEYNHARRQEVRIIRIVRDTQQSQRVKSLYNYICQVCGVRHEGSAGPYAEAAHIRPLGAPHNGSDTLDNLLCLCPNHHVLLDYGGFAISDDFSLIGIPGQLTRNPEHRISQECISYHRFHCYKAL